MAQNVRSVVAASSATAGGASRDASSFLDFAIGTEHAIS
jgi:hypothetical protein